MPCPYVSEPGTVTYLCPPFLFIAVYPEERKSKLPQRPARHQAPVSSRWRDYEVETLIGLEEFAERELRGALGESLGPVGVWSEGRLPIGFSGDPRRFFGLRSAVAVHLVRTFDVARPRALLGHENLETLVDLLRHVRSLHPSSEFSTFRVSAAGADSAVFTRLKGSIADALGLAHFDAPADLQIAVRRPAEKQRGWQVLVRLTPRPLASRSWRVCDYPAALNAAIASVMVGLAGPSASHSFLNLCCGSGTLMIERLEHAPASSVVGVDISEGALACATDNIRAAGYGDKCTLIRGDAGHVPLPVASVHELVADLPYGMLADDDVEGVYYAALREATRLAAPRARLVVVSVRKRLMESVLDRLRGEWVSLRKIPLRMPSKGGDNHSNDIFAPEDVTWSRTGSVGGVDKCRYNPATSIDRDCPMPYNASPVRGQRPPTV